jgi:enamine deaminase RidA (YjgF/YER057c/UK114 family)
MERPVSVHEFRNPAELMPAKGFSHVGVTAPGQVMEIAGQTAHGPDGSVRGSSMAEQADAALANLATALRTAGAGPEHLVAMQIYVTDVAAYRDAQPEIGQHWRRHLGKHFPTVSLFGIVELFDPAAMIEIVARAVIPQKEPDAGS